MRGIKTPKRPEVRYRRQLAALTLKLREGVAVNIIPVLRSFEADYVNDGYATSLEQAFDNLRSFYTQLDNEAKIIANSFVESANTVNKDRFYRAMEKAVGVDLSSIVQDEGLADILIASTQENVALIRSIPQEYLKKVETAIYTGTTQGNTAGSMVNQLREIGKVTTNRAKLIARDQSSKLNSALSQQRQQNLGGEEYVWRTADDARVRPTHDANDGKTFRWDSPPPATGHPGQDVQCRCVAQPILNL